MGEKKTKKTSTATTTKQKYKYFVLATPSLVLTFRGIRLLRSMTAYLNIFLLGGNWVCKYGSDKGVDMHGEL